MNMQILMARVVAVFIVMEAFLFFASARWVGSAYMYAGASWAQAFQAGSENWEIGGLLLVAAILYAFAPDLRPGLRIVAIICGFYGMWTLIHAYSFIGSWNPLHGNIIAISGLASVFFVLIGVAAVAEFIVIQRTRR